MLFCCFGVITASAATLNVVDGELLGAFRVSVGGSFYDVEFLPNTSCVEAYTGCDEPCDLTFIGTPTALDASKALLDQVFLDVPAGAFDTQPNLMAGCDTISCYVVTPSFVGTNGSLFSLAAVNTSSIEDGFASISSSNASFWIGERGKVLALWTAVPEPSTALLMTLGFLALGSRGRRDY